MRVSHIETETEWAINEVLADAIKADMVERFKDRYDLSDLRGRVERGLKRRPRSSWRSVLRREIGDRGRGLHEEIKEAVQEYLSQGPPPDDE